MSLHDTDRVFIEGLEIEALIGIYDWERRIRQPLRFDIEMAFDNTRPAATDIQAWVVARSAKRSPARAASEARGG